MAQWRFTNNTVSRKCVKNFLGCRFTVWNFILQFEFAPLVLAISAAPKDDTPHPRVTFRNTQARRVSISNTQAR